MDASRILEYTGNALMLVLLLSLPPIIVATAVGMLVSLLQALTQIQEQTLSFAIKLVTISLMLLVVARWLGAEIYEFTADIFTSFPYLVKQ